jgi:alcohol dehydrogenase class IV
MSHALGARVRVPHGTANGILLPHVMAWNAQAAAAKLVLIARAAGVESAGSDVELALAGAAAITGLLGRIGHPQKLSDVRVVESDLAACAQLALVDGATATNPRAPRSADEIVAVYKQAL